LGDPEPADKVVEKYLRVARPRFNQLVLSIEKLLDISTLSLEEVTGRLKAAEDSGQISSPANNGGTLYLTEAEWNERHKKKEQEAKGGGGGSSSNRGQAPWRQGPQWWWRGCELGISVLPAGPQRRQMPQLRQTWPLGQGLQEQAAAQ
jgi:hypothetical protein